MTKAIDDPTSTDVDDTLISIEGEYIGPVSAHDVHLTWQPKLLVTNDPKSER